MNAAVDLPARGQRASLPSMAKLVLAVLGVASAVALLTAAFWSSGGNQQVQLTFTGLPHLQGGFYYEGWAVIDGEARSTGQFNVDANCALIDRDGNPVAKASTKRAATSLAQRCTPSRSTRLKTIADLPRPTSWAGSSMR